MCCLVLTSPAGTYSAFGLNRSTILYYDLRVKPSEVYKVLWIFYTLRLVGEPSVNTLPLTSFERSYIMIAASPHAVA